MMVCSQSGSPVLVAEQVAALVLETFKPQPKEVVVGGLTSSREHKQGHLARTDATVWRAIVGLNGLCYSSGFVEAVPRQCPQRLFY